MAGGSNIVFDKLFFAVAPFLRHFNDVVDLTLTGIR